MVACFRHAEPFCPRLPSTHTARGSLSSESWNKCAKVVNHVPSLYTVVARLFILYKDKIKTAFPKNVSLSAIAHSERIIIPPTSQKVLGFPKDLSQKVLWRGSGQSPAHPLVSPALCAWEKFLQYDVCFPL